MSRGATLAVIGITVAVLIIYGIVIGVTYSKKSFIFAEYTPKAPANSFYPLGSVTTLTPAEQLARKQALTRAPPS